MPWAKSQPALPHYIEWQVFYYIHAWTIAFTLFGYAQFHIKGYLLPVGVNR